MNLIEDGRRLGPGHLAPPAGSGGCPEGVRARRRRPADVRRWGAAPLQRDAGEKRSSSKWARPAARGHLPRARPFHVRSTPGALLARSCFPPLRGSPAPRGSPEPEIVRHYVGLYQAQPSTWTSGLLPAGLVQDEAQPAPGTEAGRPRCPATPGSHPLAGRRAGPGAALELMWNLQGGAGRDIRRPADTCRLQPSAG